MRFVIAIAVFLICPLVFANHAVAADGKKTGTPDLISFAVGQYDVFDNEEAAEFVLEYRAKSWNWNTLSPLAGVMATTDGAVYGFGGIGFDWAIDNKWIINPNFAVGAYHNGAGKDLGHGLEFRSGLELNYVTDDLSRLGVAFNHISNASLGDENPGTESLLFTYSIPVGW